MPEQNLATIFCGQCAAELNLLNRMTAAREMFGKSYLFLGGGEQIAANQAVFGIVASNYQNLTAESLAAQKVPEPMGFRVPGQSQS